MAKGTFYNDFPTKEALALAGPAVASHTVRERLPALLAPPSLDERLAVPFAEMGRIAGGRPE